MTILKVITDEELPEVCGSCYHIIVRPKGRKVFWECYFVDGNIESRDMPRPNWCPLVVEKDYKCPLCYLNEKAYTESEEKNNG